MKNIVFATSNTRKIKQATHELAAFKITVDPVELELTEIQHTDPIEIAKQKAKSAYALLNKPVVVSDTSWEIPALGGFPGGYMKDVANWLQPEDWMNLMSPHSNKTILCHEHIAYFDGKTLKHFMHSYEGRFCNKAAGNKHWKESFVQVVTMYDGETIAEHLDRGLFALSGKVLEHWQKFGRWYTGSK